MAHFKTITLCLALLCAGALAGGGKGGWAAGTLKSKSKSTNKGTDAGVWAEGDTAGEGAVVATGDAKSVNYDSVSKAGMGLLVASSGRGSAHGKGDVVAGTRRNHGSRVRSGAHGSAHKDAVVYSDTEALAANREGVSFGKSGLSVEAYRGKARGVVKGDSQGNDHVARSHMKGQGETHGDANVKAGAVFGSEGGRGYLHDQVDGTLVVDSQKPSKKPSKKPAY